MKANSFKGFVIESEIETSDLIKLGLFEPALDIQFNFDLEDYNLTIDSEKMSALQFNHNGVVLMSAEGEVQDFLTNVTLTFSNGDVLEIQWYDHFADRGSILLVKLNGETVHVPVDFYNDGIAENDSLMDTFFSIYELVKSN